MTRKQTFDTIQDIFNINMIANCLEHSRDKQNEQLLNI